MEEIEGKLKKIERIEGYELPEYFKQFYKEHNGGMVGNIEFLMLDEIINEINRNNASQVDFFNEIVKGSLRIIIIITIS